jgi:NTP pyrophosphatase (non-canonical NTP hydrolase)
MPTYSSAIADNLPEPQRPQQPVAPRRPRAREFWEMEPGDPGTEQWQDNPSNPTGPQGVPAAQPTPAEQQQEAVQNMQVVVTKEQPKKYGNYIEFVDQVTSAPSKDNAQFIARVASLQAEGCDIQRLLTAAVGIAAEGGEFMEIVKKITFQGKPWNQDNIEHLKIELGDVMWYVAQACMALDISLEEVLDRNINKLAARYPEGTFDEYYSENRKAGDR